MAAPVSPPPTTVNASPSVRAWATAHDQFGSSGCVGCGRCIAWCPTGIDITQEVSALASLQDVAATDEDRP